MNDAFLPTGSVLCPRGGCRVLDPRNFNGGLTGFVNVVVAVASIGTYVIGALAILFVLYGAFLFLLGGDKGREKGQKVIVNAIIAICIAALGQTGIQLLLNVLNEFRI